MSIKNFITIGILVVVSFCAQAEIIVPSNVSWESYVYSNGKAAITSASRTSSNSSQVKYLQIPSLITPPMSTKDFPVAYIYPSVFSDTGFSIFTSVLFPVGVESVGESAFSGCSGLKRVFIEQNGGLAAWCAISFGNKSANPLYFAHKICFRTSIISGGTWTESTEDGNTGIENLMIPTSVTNIGSYAFSECSSLKSLTISSNVTKIGKGAFSNCSGLTNVTIGINVTSIGESAFHGCSGITNLRIPSKVEDIGESAFRFCGITNVMMRIPACVTNIGNHAFSGPHLKSVFVPNGCYVAENAFPSNCVMTRYTPTEMVDGVNWTYIVRGGSAIIYNSGYTAIANDTMGAVTVPDRLGAWPVTAIGAGAFAGCSGLTSVTIPSSVTSIGASAFSGCNGIKNVTISGDVSIKENAFSGCDRLKSVTVGPDVRSFSTKAFLGCSGLESFVVSSGNKAYRSVNGLLLSQDGKLVCVPAGCTIVTIPNDVKSIEEFAFSGCSSLTNVTIPNSVTNIADGAFHGCSGLEEITLPFVGKCRGNTGSSSGFGYIFGRNSYSGGIRVRQYYTEYPYNYEAQGRGDYFYSFDSNYHDYYIPAKLKKVVITDEIVLGYGAFRDCSGLTSVIIPNGVVRVAKGAFYGCNGLTNVVIPDSLRRIETYAFYGCSGLTAVYITSIAAWCDILYDGPYANPLCYAQKLYLNGSLVDGDLKIPDSVTYIRDHAFCNCKDISSVTIPNSVTSIGSSAFSGCSGLTSVTMPNSVTNIGSSAFSRCSGLTSITIPNSVKSLGEGTFSCCSGLEEITLPFVGAYRGGSGASSLFGYIFGTSTYDGGRKTMQEYGYSTANDYYSEYYIPSKLRKVVVTDERLLGFGAFFNCDGLTNVTINSGLVRINVKAFYNCRGLTSVTIPNGVTSIRDYAFSGCNGLNSVTIPDSVTNIGEYAFVNCNYLKAVHITDLVKWCGIPFSNVSANPLYYANNLYLNGALVKDMTIPESVTHIGNFTFSGCSGLTSVVIHNNVTSIGDGAFSDCSGLTSVTIPDSVTSLGVGAFCGCSSLTSVTIPDGVTSIERNAFSDCSGLTSVTIPDGVTKIGDDAFSRCSGLTSVTIPDGVTSIGEEAFKECNGLTSVTIPNSVRSIGRSAFWRCEGLTSVMILDGVTSIGDYAFIGCRSLTSVTIPNSVTSIGNGAFKDCSGLSGIYVANGDSERVRTCMSDSGFNVNNVEFLEGLWVVFAANGGSVDVPRRDVTSGGAVGDLPTPTRTGYKFAGWWTAAAGGVQISASTIVTGSFGCIMYYAHWTPNKYAITLDQQGGSGGTANVTATYGSSMPSITVPTRTGYTFGGYYTSSGGSGTQYYTASGASARIWNKTSTITLYAKWTAKSCTVTLDQQGGSGGTSSVTATYDSAMPSITVPTRAGYAFGGYYTTTGGSGTQYYNASGKSVRTWDKTSVTTLYAKWTVICVVTLDQQDGSGGTASVTVTYGSAMPTITVPTRTGYAFGGFYTSTGGSGTQYYTASGTSARKWDKTVATTLYAKWSEICIVSLDRQGGSGGSSSLTATNGIAMPSITVPTRTGYTFGGYYTSTGGGGTQYYTASGASARTWDKTSATTLYAKWTAKTCTVNLDQQSGSGGTASVTVTYGNAMPSITVPTRAGYAFGGYYTSTGGSGTQYYTASGTSARTWDKTSATTLYAKWTVICVVTLDQQGGSGGTASVMVTYGSAMPTITVPTRTGYVFGGYYTSTGGSGTQYYTASGTSARKWDKTVATTLYAKWSSTCSVTLDLQHGYSGTTNVTATYGIAMPAITVPNRYGYTFGGYWTEPNGSGTQYYTASGASARTCNMTDAVTLYAKWTANTSTVTFNKQGGSGGTSSVTATYGSAMPSITVPTRAGYKFKGYYYKYQNNEPTPPTNKPYYTASGASARNWDWNGPKTLYAEWTVNARCTVTLDQQGGSGGTSSVTATNGVAMPPVTVPVRAGYTFGGYWTKSGGIGTRYYTESGTSARIWDRSSKATLYAHWSEASTASYCVIDLSSGTNAVSYPVTYMAAPPSGGFNTTTYKTTKLVLRRIEPGSFKMCGKYDVMLTNPFYCGIFEVTQRQYELVMGSNPSTNKGNTRPVNVSWNSFRGNSSTYNWPDSNRVAPSSFVGKLQSRTGLNLDLPTEAQWEYACRAGTTNNYNNGGDSEGDLDLVGRYKGNESDGKGGYSTKHTAVGSYQPNRWGLYDMHGNVQEYCLDRYGDPVSGGIDPTGSSSGTNRVTRGGSYYNNANICTSSYRSNANASGKYVNNGFRLVRTLPDSYIVLTLDLKGGSLGTASATRLVAPGAAVGTLPTPTRTGYLFCGWWTAEKSGTQVAAATRVTANVTYYAHWQFMGAANETNIVFDTESSYEAESDGSFSLDLLELVGSTSTPKLTVKGLPAGLKFDAKTMTISGTVTKPGVYTVMVSATNATVNKPFTESFTITVPNLTSEMMPNLKPNNNAYGTILCGVAFEPSLVDCSPKAGWTVKAAGLPAGLKYDAKTGKITGVPTKAGTYTVTFTASKKGEKNQIATITLKVEALPDWAQGTFTGYVRRDVDADVTDASLTDYGSATMTVSAVGKISGKMSVAGTNWTFSATAFSRVSLKSENGSPDSLLVEAVAKAGKASRAISLAVREGQNAAELVNGVAEGNVDGVSVMLWRNMWKDKATAAATKEVLAGFEGVYTVSLVPDDDHGAGYLSLSVGKNGNVKTSGKLADGTAVSASSLLMYDADAGWFVYVYAAPTAYKGGAFATGIGFSKGEGVTRLSPTMGSSWRNFNPQATGAYGAGFDRVLDFTGAYYNTLDSLKAYYDAMRFGLGGVPTLEYSFKRAYFDDNGRKATVTTLGVAGAVDTFSQEGMTVSVDDKGKIVVSKATKPAQNKETKEWSYDGANDGALTLSFTQATGIFKGSYTFWYDYMSAADETTGKETLTHTSKKVSFEGIMVQGVELLQGFYLWDANGAYEDEKTGKQKTYKYKLSYPVQLVPSD